MLGYPLGWLIGAVLFFLLIFAAAMSSVVIHGNARRIGDNDHAELQIKALLGLVNYHWELPIMRVKGFEMELKREVTEENMGGKHSGSSLTNLNPEKIMQSIEKAQMLLKHTDNLLGWVRTMLSHVKLVDWQWRTAVGTGDAMWTAMATGMVWSVKTTAIGVLSQLVRLQAQPEIAVDPNFERAQFSTDGQFTAKIRFGYAIYAGIVLMRRVKKVHGTEKGLLGWQKILLKA
ncbi:DUF2953 domain-containing protein [Paenibacillus oenotherae]|uniref:DUF2953 domain-containing protein n=1 Tax=Paenibacillus oenotherae TaxID=1435645 RepID=A0ABS7D2T6_9BACL|nr:DUF2953 domain-containing protein [Paenibacillus oenotherae]MBW7473498.1 DUF2953 domain-containing protein [Paenibacillus oenotherae]